MRHPIARLSRVDPLLVAACGAAGPGGTDGSVVSPDAAAHDVRPDLAMGEGPWSATAPVFDPAEGGGFRFDAGGGLALTVLLRKDPSHFAVFQSAVAADLYADFLALLAAGSPVVGGD